MPIDPAKDTFIELDRGEQLRIEKDTDYLWRPKPNSINLITDLALEGGGRCFYYHLEDGVWYCSEYIGNLERIPEFKRKYKALEAEARERETARQGWEQKMGGAAISAGVVNAGGTAPGAPGSPTTDPENAGATSQRADHNMSVPQSWSTATASQSESEFSLSSAHNQNEPHFPGAEVTEPPVFPTPTHFPAADTGTDVTRDGFPDRHSHFPNVNIPRMPSYPPSFPFGPEAHPPLPPSFPPSFPFGPNSPPPQVPSFSSSFPFGSGHSASQPPPSSFPGHPSSPGPSDRQSRRTVIDGGEYVRVEGRVVNTGTSNSAAMTGHDMNLDWSPDLHQERNGTYNVNWSR